MPRTEVQFFNNGNTAVIDYNGGQVSELQKSWLLFYVDFLVEQGIDPTEVNFSMPCGGYAIVVKTKSGYNWSIT
jgi:hypothetical protein